MRMNASRRALLGGVALAVCGAAKAAAGSVDALSGEGYAQAPAERALAVASDVFVGDVVGTRPASTMSLRLGRSTQVKLGPETRMKIDRFVVNLDGVLVLDRGGLLVDHDPAASKLDLRVRSPFGLIAVRGTRFFAGPSNGVFGVFVQRGAVTVIGVYTAVQIGAGMGTGIARPGAEPTEPVVWGAGRVAAALAFVGEK